ARTLLGMPETGHRPELVQVCATNSTAARSSTAARNSKKPCPPPPAEPPRPETVPTTKPLVSPQRTRTHPAGANLGRVRDIPPEPGSQARRAAQLGARL